MIKSVKVTNYLGETVKIVLNEDNPSHGLLITSIDGLGPAKANINKTDIASNDGSFYNSARLDPRNIVIKMLFTEADTIEKARLNTYRYFPIKRRVDLEIETDTRTVTTSGYIESNEPDIFSKTEGNTVSIICPDPYLYAKNSNEYDFNTIVPNFEFPFSDDEPIEFSIVELALERNVYYDGEIEIGIVLSIHVLSDPGTISIYNLLNGESMTISDSVLEELIGSHLQAGDDIVISTVRGEKKATLLRGGEELNILNCLGRRTDWFTLVKGDNLFAVTTTYGNENIQIKITNRIAYEGV